MRCALRSRLGGLDLQHPRRRRGAHAGRPLLRDRAAHGHAAAVRRFAASSRTKCATRSAKLAELHERDLEDQLTKLAPGKTVRLDQATAPRRLADVIEQAGGTVEQGRRSGHPAEGGQERRRDRRRPRRARARRRGAGALSRLARPRSAAGQRRRDRRGRGAGNLPPRHRRAEGHLVPDHLRRRPERRHRALPRHRARPTASSSPASCYLVDSGAQYEDGTTDITRTVAIGEPTRGDARPLHPRAQGPYRDRRARVFPDGTTGAQIDALRARAALWQAGLDYDHGTGHGVGSYLSVHEGPPRISKLGTAPLEARHDPVQRARLLQDRRLRHPHREPGARGRAPDAAGRREADASRSRR